MALLACGSGGDGLAAGHEREQSFDKPCERPFVRDEVEAFSDAVNDGSRPAFEAALTDEPAFRVFSQSLDYRHRAGRFFTAKSKERVVSHLLKRARKGDRMRLASLTFGGADRSFEICNIGYVIWRKIGDRRRAGERFVGKGAVSFDGGIAVWNTGAPKRFFG